jgi:hypothetical protein
MNWYYALNDEQLGPVDQATLDQLAQEGTITPQTLVWHSGLRDWQSLAVALRPPNAPASGGNLCSECHRAFPTDEVVKLGSGYVCAACKPIALQKLQEGVLGDGSSEHVRQQHLKHEASIKSLGLLYLIGATSMGLVAIMGLVVPVMMLRQPSGGASVGLPAAPMILMLGLAAFFFVTGIGIRKLKPWARIASGILAGLGLLAIPIGTLINAYILWLLFSKKGATVFSDDYKRIIAETPHVRQKTSIVVWVLIGLVVALVLFGLIGAVVG